MHEVDPVFAELPMSAGHPVSQYTPGLSGLRMEISIVYHRDKASPAGVLGRYTVW